MRSLASRISAGILAVAFMAGSAISATCTWTGSWNNTPLGADDHIVIASGGNLVWSNNLPATVASWTQQDTYAGTVTIATVYGGAGFTNLTIMGNVVIAGGSWTHTANTASESNRMRVAINGNLMVTNATIGADGRGHSTGNGPGSAGSSQVVVGGAHGGTTGGNFGLNAKTYGAIEAPVNLGSGGGKAAGGGAILLTVGGTTTVATAGMISANGSSAGDGGGGSGGSVFLTTGTLLGSGTIRANGGAGPSGNNSGGGSGGRVAIILTGNGSDFTDWSGVNAAFGTGSVYSAAGTVYRRAKDGTDELIIDNNNALSYGQYATLMPSGVNLHAYSNVIIRNRGTLGVNTNTTVDFNTIALTIQGTTNAGIAIQGDANVTYPTHWTIDGFTLYPAAVTSNKITHLTIGTNGVMSHGRNGASEAYKIDLAIAGNLTVLSNGVIMADRLGYNVTQGPGGGTNNTQTGGAYGGVAGRDSLPYNARTYGSILNPANIGSGGYKGLGGGAILLNVAGTTTVAAGGLITANGGSAPDGGGGSGGTVRLVTGWLAGGGSIRVNGGAGPGGNSSGGGSGGRIAIALTGANADFSPAWSGLVSACGTGATVSAAGTIYRHLASQPNGAGTVTADNGNLNVNTNTFTTIPAFTNATEGLTLTRWEATGKTHLGLLTNATIRALSLAGTNSTLELAGFTLNVEEFMVNGIPYMNGTYTPVEISRLKDRAGGGKVVVYLAAKGSVITFK